MNKQQKAGVALIIAPTVIFIFDLIVFAIVSFVLTASSASSSGLSPATSTTTIGIIVRVVLGIVGIVSLIGMPVGLVAGIIWIIKGSAPQVMQAAADAIKPPTQNLPPTPQA